MLLIVFAVVATVFSLNDFVWMRLPTYESFVIFEAGHRLAICVLMLSFERLRQLNDLGYSYRPTLNKFFSCFLVITVINMVWVGSGQDINAEYDWLVLYNYPVWTTKTWLLFDVTVGLALVSISETLAFIVLPLRICQDKQWRLPIIIILSSLVFGFAHWSLGPVFALFATVANILMFWIAIRTKSIGMVIVSHFIVDFHFLFLAPLINGKIW